MNNLESYIKKISKAVDDWLQPDNFDLKKAIDQTVQERLFSIQDIKHQILVLKSSLQEKNLMTWAERSKLKTNSLRGKKVLCLHAGNLPLVGIQDLLAVAMAGGDYFGKISKKDPYLLPTLLEKFEKYNFVEANHWKLNIDDFSHKKMDAILFAGSEESAAVLKSSLLISEIIDNETPTLMRTAHFSMALIEDNQPQTMEDLTEAAFRYGGTGCRSVAIVVAPFHLNSEKCEFTDYIESFWLQNPQLKKPNETLYYRYAYNRGLEIPQAWLDNFLIEENVSKPKEKFLLYWVKGDMNTLTELAGKYRDGLQSIYSTSNHIGKNILGYQIESLSSAQSPPIWWKPDQVDTIQWLQKKVAHQ